ncbi:MAG: acetone carboxylase subunit gamma [Porticoccus sp.]|nr:acetone carboxylase subunit gamma [Porticoccus sp.]
MKVLMTEYLRIDLETENWECRVCEHVVGSARGNYKEGLLAYKRNPEDIHPSVIDPDKYKFTFCPDKDWVSIYEFYCPSCGTQMEVEYTFPGHAPLYDMEVDVDALKEQWSHREEILEPVKGPNILVDRTHGHNH